MRSITLVKSVILALAFCGAQDLLWAEEALVKRFVQPPGESRPWCYWYWMNGNVSREGIVADLKGMQDVGVGGVLLFDIGIHPAGKVSNRSPEWYDLVKLAVSEAAKRGIKVSFHCPGWSASGGPWITPDRGMQELTWSETTVEGPREFAAALAQPPNRLNCYRDAAVLAFPTPANDSALPVPRFLDAEGKVLSQGAAALDGDSSTIAELPAEFDLVYPQAVEVRSVFVRAARGSGSVGAEWSVWDEATGRFRRIATIQNYTSGPFSSQLGSASFAPVRASKFRLSFNRRKPGAQIYLEQLTVSGGFRVSDWPCKAGFATDPVAAQSDDVKPGPADVIAPDQVVDLTSKVRADGTLAWSVPSGRWTILRLGYTPTGVHIAPAPLGGDGLECDKLSREVADFHYDACVTPVLKDLGPALTQEAVAYYHVDSYEAGWQNWTAKFPQDFKARRGYDLTRYLPALTGRVVGDLATTERFLWDFRRTIGDLFADAHYGRLAERCHADGLKFSTEPYGGPFEMLQVGGRADHPMMEFWLPTKPQGRKFASEAVSVGHTTGRSIIGAESFTSGPPEERWNSHPFSLKALGDYIYSCGVNRFVIHVSAHQPLVGEAFKPGFTCGCNGIHFDRGNTWWEHGAKEWVDYLTRCQSLLQAGEPVADALYFLGNDSPYGCGPFEPALPEGYDYDACNSEVLAGLTVKNGQVTLPGGKPYRYLVLPHRGRVTLASLRKLVALAKDGARLIGQVPKESPSLTDAALSAEYGRLAGELARHAVNPRSFEAILAADRLAPDFAFDEEPGLVLHATHRKIDDAEVYFVASASTNVGVVDCRFRVTGKVPELWRPDRGTMEPCAVYEQDGDVMRIPLRFEPAGSVFVVFRPGKAAPHAVAVTSRDSAAVRLRSALSIVRASYGDPDDSQNKLDVTKKLAACMRDGFVKLSNFDRLGGDPAPGIRKQLRVDYTVAGKPGTVSVQDGDWLRLPPPEGKLMPSELKVEGKQLVLQAWEAGQYAVSFPGGRTQVVEVAAVPAPTPIAGPWDVRFGGPKSEVRGPKVFQALEDWTKRPEEGIKYYSGTAVYRKTFDSDVSHLTSHASRLFLDLGRVEVIAEVWLNGKSLGTLWKPPFRVEVTEALKEGANELEIHVTNLWPNRLIGDEEYPDDLAEGYTWTDGGIHSWPEWVKTGGVRPEPRRQTFFTWKHWNKGESLWPSGLLGPVVLQSVRSVPVGE